MPTRIPSPEEIGLVAPQADRPAVSYRGGIAAEGQMALGQAEQRSGQQITQTGLAFQDANDRVAFAGANANFLQRKLALDQEFENDTDYTTKPQRYAQAISQAANESAGPILNADLKAQFIDRTMRWQEYGIEQMQRQAHANAVDADRAHLNDSVQRGLDAASGTTDQAARAAILGGIGQQVDAYAAKGSITDQEAVKLKQQIPNLYAERYFKTLADTDPGLAAHLLLPGAPTLAPGVPTELGAAIHKASAITGANEDVLARTAQLEGGGRATNPATGAAGPFQFTPGTARAYGLSDPNDAGSSALAAANLQNDNKAVLTAALGREPAGSELYLAHQQGAAGAASLLLHPDQNAVATLTPVYGGDAARARQAILLNGGTAQMSAADFTQMWRDKYAGTAGHVSAATPQPTHDDAGNVIYPQTGDLRDFLRPDQRAQLADIAMNRAQALARAQEADQARQERQQTKALRDASDQTEQRAVADIMGVGDNKDVTAQQIADPKGPYNQLLPDARMRMISFAEREAKGEPLAPVSHQTAISLMDGIRSRRITDMAPVYDAYGQGKLTNADFAFVQNQFQQSRTDDGQRLDQTTQRFLQAVRPSIEKSNPLMGQIDMGGGTLFFGLQQDVAAKIAAYRKEGKDPFDLFDPAKPDYVGNPEALAPYQKSIPESLDDFKKRMEAPPAKPALLPVAPVDNGGAAQGAGKRPSLDQIFAR